MIAQRVPGPPSRAVFAWVGVVERWEKRGNVPSPVAGVVRDGTTNCEPIATTVFTGECGFSSDLGNKSLRASVVKTILQFSNEEGSSYGNHSIGTSQDENHGRKLSARRSQPGQRLHSRRLQRRPADDRQTRGRVCGQRGPAQRREDRAQGLVGV